MDIKAQLAVFMAAVMSSAWSWTTTQSATPSTSTDVSTQPRVTSDTLTLIDLSTQPWVTSDTSTSIDLSTQPWVTSDTSTMDISTKQPVTSDTSTSTDISTRPWVTSDTTPSIDVSTSASIPPYTSPSMSTEPYQSSDTTLPTSTMILTAASEKPEPHWQNVTSFILNINTQQEIKLPSGFSLHSSSFLCLNVFGNDSLPVKFLFRSDKDMENMTEAIRMFEVTNEILCRNLPAYRQCMNETVENNDTYIDSKLHMYIDRDDSDTAFDLHCHNKGSSASEMKCSIPSIERHCCLYGGIMGVLEYITNTIRSLISDSNDCAKT